MTQTIAFLGKTYARETFTGSIADNHLTEMSGSELVELFNIIADNLELKGVKKFADKETAIRRTWNALVEFQNIVEAADDVEEKPKAKAKKKPSDKPKGPAYANATFTRKRDPNVEIKLVRPDTNRGKLVELLKEGATFDQCVEATDFGKNRKGFSEEKSRKACYEAIRLLHLYVGYGIKQSQDGIIKLVR